MYSIGLDVSKSTINCYIPNEEIDLAIDNNEKSLNPDYAIGKFQSKQTYYKI